MSAATRLQLSSGGFPSLSARGCVENLSILPLGEMERTINGKLVFLGDPDLKKYACLMKGKDRMPPAFENLKRGQVLKVACLSTLTQKWGDNAFVTQLDRNPVPDSVDVYLEKENKPLFIECIKEREVTLKEKSVGETFVSYRPYLEMMVIDFGTETDEWKLTCQWYLKLEEI